MNINALKALYVALGGKLTNTYSDIADGIAVADYVLLADVISAIAKIAGGSIDLPAVTSADNGSMLTVNNGAWAKGNFGDLQDGEVLMLEEVDGHKNWQAYYPLEKEIVRINADSLKAFPSDSFELVSNASMTPSEIKNIFGDIPSSPNGRIPIAQVISSYDGVSAVQCALLTITEDAEHSEEYIIHVNGTNIIGTTHDDSWICS